MEDCPKVAIIILNWNGWRDTIECLESLYRIIYQNYQVILVDNGSTNNSVDMIRDWARGYIGVDSPCIVDSVKKPVTIVEYSQPEAVVGGSELIEAQIEYIPPAHRLILISNETNLGFAAGSNVGLRYALQRGYPYLGLLNNDTIVTPNYLSMLVQTLQDDSALAGVSPKILHKNNPTSIFYAGGWIKMWEAAKGQYIGYRQADSDQWNGLHSTTLLSGACLVARRELFENIGLMDEDFFFSMEEYAFSYAAWKRGFKIAVNLDAVIYHAEGSSYNDDNVFRVYHLTKNRLLFLKKYGTFMQQLIGFSTWFGHRPISLLRFLFRGGFPLVLAHLRGISDFLRGRYGDWDRDHVSSMSNLLRNKNSLK